MPARLTAPPAASSPPKASETPLKASSSSPASRRPLPSTSSARKEERSALASVTSSLARLEMVRDRSGNCPETAGALPLLARAPRHQPQKRALVHRVGARVAVRRCHHPPQLLLRGEGHAQRLARRRQLLRVEHAVAVPVERAKDGLHLLRLLLRHPAVARRAAQQLGGPPHRLHRAKQLLEPHEWREGGGVELPQPVQPLPLPCEQAVELLLELLPTLIAEHEAVDAAGARHVQVHHRQQQHALFPADLLRLLVVHFEEVRLAGEALGRRLVDRR
mmetsp:Transcript_38888/g.130078  ORF Transcript_38888/g.130078 Transcript_38888/m.130078 type:complete len:276 (-) Transcript_38888:307-1134(-)